MSCLPQHCVALRVVFMDSAVHEGNLRDSRMISRLKTANFSILKNAEFNFAPGLNVITGSNGTGKSHILKLAYTAARWSYEMSLREKRQMRPDKATLQKELAGKLVDVFRCDGLGRLSTRGQGVQRTEVDIRFRSKPKCDFSLSFSTKSTTDAVLDKVPQEFYPDESVFFPTKEMLSMYPGFVSLYDNNALQIDETYYDLCKALAKPLSRGPKLAEIRPLLNEVEGILQGQIELVNDRFYLQLKHGGRFEIPLVAEGFRKLGAVAYLLANGTVARQSILFWDEPETNLNPAYMVKLARLLVAIARNNTQVFIATHSLFMVRELSLLLMSPEWQSVTRMFYALDIDPVSRGVRISHGDSAEEIEPIAALDAEIAQSERYIESQPGGVA